MSDRWRVSASRIDVTEVPRDRLTMLRLGHGAEHARPAVAAALGVALPDVPNTATGDNPRAIWMGPDEWMVIGDAGDAASVQAAAEGATILAVDVGAGRYAVDVTGNDARDLLAKACSLDLHPAKFASGRTAMTLFAQVPVVIDHADPSGYRLYFDISHRAYLRTWFADAVVEFD